MLRRCIFILTIATLLVLGHSRMIGAEPSSDVVGTWVFHVTIIGSEPCECTQIATLRADSSLEGPGNDQFTGQARGVWAKTGASKVSLTFAQNSFNKDGTASGYYTVSGTMTLAGRNAGAGSTAFTLKNNRGVVVASGKATFTAERLEAAH